MYNRGEIMPMIYAVMSKIRSCELSKKKLKNSQQRRYCTQKKKKRKKTQKDAMNLFPGRRQSLIDQKSNAACNVFQKQIIHHHCN